MRSPLGAVVLLAALVVTWRAAATLRAHRPAVAAALAWRGRQHA